MNRMRFFSVEDIERVIPGKYEAAGNRSLQFSSIEPLFDARPGALTWMRADLEGGAEALLRTGASIVVCAEGNELPATLMGERCLILVENPQHAFLRILNDLFAPRERRTGIHPSAIVDPGARIGRDVYIGPFAVVGSCEIGDEVEIDAYSLIGDRVTIGSRSLIREHCSIGGQGFGHVINERGKIENMAHIGQVLIGEDVEIFPYVNVDRATLGTTTIANSAKIDHYCHIGHNTAIGEGAILTPGVVLLGGARVGSFAWIGAGTVVRDATHVGDHAFVGMCSVVTKNIPAGERWVGAPARTDEEYRRLQNRLRGLIQPDREANT